MAAISEAATQVAVMAVIPEAVTAAIPVVVMAATQVVVTAAIPVVVMAATQVVVMAATQVVVMAVIPEAVTADNIGRAVVILGLDTVGQVTGDQGDNTATELIT